MIIFKFDEALVLVYKKLSRHYTEIILIFKIVTYKVVEIRKIIVAMFLFYQNQIDVWTVCVTCNSSIYWNSKHWKLFVLFYLPKIKVHKTIINGYLGLSGNNVAKILLKIITIFLIIIFFYGYTYLFICLNIIW